MIVNFADEIGKVEKPQIYLAISGDKSEIAQFFKMLGANIEYLNAEDMSSLIYGDSSAVHTFTKNWDELETHEIRDFHPHNGLVDKLDTE